MFMCAFTIARASGMKSRRIILNKVRRCIKMKDLNQCKSYSSPNETFISFHEKRISGAAAID